MKKIITWKVIIASLLYIHAAHACITTFMNDKNARIFIFDEDEKIFVSLGKNQKRRLGNHYKKIHFSVYIQQSNKPIFAKKYTCKQMQCGKNGNVLLKFSELENGSASAALFQITKHKPHSSMVNKLPIMKSSTF